MDVGKGREQDAEALASDFHGLQASRAKDSLLHSYFKTKQTQESLLLIMIYMHIIGIRLAFPCFNRMFKTDKKGCPFGTAMCQKI